MKYCYENYKDVVERFNYTDPIFCVSLIEFDNFCFTNFIH